MSNPLHDKYFLELAEKWRNQTITDDELKELEQWYKQDQDNTIEIPHSFAASEQELSERILKAIKQKAGIDPLELQATTNVIPIKKYPFRFFKYAAAVLILTSAILYFLYTGKPKAQAPQQSTANVQEEILPPTAGAVLTLSNGKRIVLDTAKGHIANEGGVSVVNKDGSVVYSQPKTHDAKKRNSLQYYLNSQRQAIPANITGWIKSLA